jgi:hypothetical protein
MLAKLFQKQWKTSSYNFNIFQFISYIESLQVMEDVNAVSLLLVAGR